MKMKLIPAALMSFFLGAMLVQQANAAIALDRTRIIFDGGSKSMSLNISNKNKELPYLAQGWIEDADGNKIDSPLILLPPLQRVEPQAKSQIKIQSLPGINLLSQNKETLFYFNLREIPPRSNKPNTLQIALQTRIKMFYRPHALVKNSSEMIAVFKEKVTLTRENGKYRVNNSSPYFFTVAAAGTGNKELSEVKPTMIAPQSNAVLPVSAEKMGNAPEITFINDYGGRPKLVFHCNGTECRVGEYKEG
ncbi:fimbria/pilus periplasmic chaperone [uncultured Pantoea sp.]|uniref:fimbria/pilus periplasmic chaperone n=1 Tax=unclassified Pantoea TaxID=2630326 RepID=UPI0025FFA938|nr:fimbria/pilus periplasmic chaperone [uncultured Pantoea sp.]